MTDAGWGREAQWGQPLPGGGGVYGGGGGYAGGGYGSGGAQQHGGIYGGEQPRLTHEDRPTVNLPAVPAHVRSHRAGRGGRSVGVPTEAPQRDGAVRVTLRGFGELMITFGFVVLLFAAFELWGKTIQVHSTQDHLSEQLQQQWQAAPNKPAGAAPLPGNALARLYIPKLGLKLIVVEGVTLDDIRNAPGHYPGTAMPGEIGNFSVAGHRENGIFMDLNQLGPGDQIIVQTKDMFYVYNVYQQQIVQPTAVDVVNPVPGQPASVKPTKQLITLTTCNPWYSNTQRLIIHGQQSRQQLASAGQPKELGKLAGS